MTDHDFGPAVDRLIDGGPPPESWGGPPRPIPPRPLPRHLCNPAPRRRWGADRATTSRRRRYLRVLDRIVRKAA